MKRQLILCAVLLAGCGGRRDQAPVEAHWVSIATSPDDLTTAIQPPIAFSLELSDSLSEPLDPVVEELKGTVALRRMDTHEIVPIDVFTNTIGDVDASPIYELQVVPSGEMDPNLWYEFAVSDEGIDNPKPVEMKRFDDGKLGARVRLGSWPVVSEFAICPKQSGPYVRITFSEPVRQSGESLSQALRLTDAATGAEITCTGYDPGTEMPAFDPSQLSQAWYLDCGELPSSFRLQVLPQTVSAGGTGVLDFETSSLFDRTLSEEQLKPNRDCEIWAP